MPRVREMVSGGHPNLRPITEHRICAIPVVRRLGAPPTLLRSREEEGGAIWAKGYTPED